MLALIGEKTVRLFPTNMAIEGIAPFSVSHEDFYENYYKNTSKIVLDNSFVEFHLDCLRNTGIYEALESLQCKNKIIGENEKAYFVFNEYINFLKNKNFYIQTVTVENQEFLQRIFAKDIFIAEDAIRKLCKDVTDIDENTWWIYIAKHKSSGMKIAAGIGNGIAYTRYFDDQNEIEKKVIETIKFLVREGLNKNVKIISFVEDLYIDNLEIYTPSYTRNDIEIDIAKIIINENIDPIFSKDNFVRRFLKKYEQTIFVILVTASIFFFLSFGFLYNKAVNMLNDVETEEEGQTIITEDRSKSFFAKINHKNMEYMRAITETLQDIRNPIKNLDAVSDILNEHSITAEKITIKKNDIKIKCNIDNATIAKLQKLKSDSLKIEIKLVDEQKSDYENIENDTGKNYGVEICIKTK